MVFRVGGANFFLVNNLDLERLVFTHIGGGKLNPMFTKSVYGPADGSKSNAGKGHGLVLL